MIETQKPKRPSILVVDDNLSDVHTVLRRLHGQPYGVRHARTGAEALELVAKHEYVAVLLDQRLPDMPGIQVCQAMRDHGVVSPILFCSSLEDDALARQALAAGATDYMIKDIALPNLAQVLGSHIQLV